MPMAAGVAAHETGVSLAAGDAMAGLRTMSTAS